MSKIKQYVFFIGLMALVFLTFNISSVYAIDKINTNNLKVNYLNIPLYFEINQGQTNKQVKFLSRGYGHTIYLTQKNIVLVLNNSISQKTNPKTFNSKNISNQKLQTEVINLNFLGANNKVQIQGIGGKEGISNYFIGNNPSKWIKDIPNYKEVRYKNIYPGIDMLFYGNQRNLEFDFVLSSNANPKDIQIQAQGAKKIYVDKKGNLILLTKQGKIIYKNLIIYQNIGGIKKQIQGTYTLNTKKDIISFALGTYNKTSPLIIDPVLLVYSTYLGGNIDDIGRGIAINSQGDAYVTGYTSSTTFPTTPGAFQTSNNNMGTGQTAFVTELKPTGTGLVYSTYLGGGGGLDPCNGIAINSQGDAYVTGYTSSTTFPTTPGAFQTSNNNMGTGQTAFVTELNPTGTGLVYSTYLGGNGNNNYNGDSGNGIAIDSQGDAYITGFTDSTDFPTQNAFQTNNNNTGTGQTAFVTELNPTGTGLIYSTYLGGNGNNNYNGDSGNGIAINSLGDAYVTGYTDSTNFPTTPGAFQTINNSSEGTAFVTELNPTGTSLIYSTYLGGNGNNNYNGDSGNGIAINSLGDAYVTGYTDSTNFPTTPGAFQTINNSSEGTAFITELNIEGTGLIYSTYLGGNEAEQYNVDSGNGIAVNSLGDAYITGYTDSTNFPTTPGAFQTTNNSSNGTAFVTELNSTGTGLIYSTYLGGNGENSGDSGNSIAIDSLGDAYVTGYTDSTNFPTQNAFQTTNNSSNGTAFVTKISPMIPTSLPISPGGTGGIPVEPLAVVIVGLLLLTKTTQRKKSKTLPTTGGEK
jgi:hypothetical protein